MSVEVTFIFCYPVDNWRTSRGYWAIGSLCKSRRYSQEENRAVFNGLSPSSIIYLIKYYVQNIKMNILDIKLNVVCASLNIC